MLTGTELLDAMKKLADKTPSEAAAACGYISKTGRIQIAKFYKALLSARGMFGEAAKRRGKVPSYMTRVQPNGNIVVNAAYTKKLRLRAGTPILITVNKRCISLSVDYSTLGEKESAQEHEEYGV